MKEELLNLIKKVYPISLSLNVESKASHELTNAKKQINKNWEYLGVYHNKYSKIQCNENKLLLERAFKCNFITADDKLDIEIFLKSLKVQNRHVVYVEKLTNIDKKDSCIYKLISKTTDPYYFGKSNFEIRWNC